MNEDFGGDIITISDEDGNEFDLELLDTIEFEGQTYCVFVPADIENMDVNDPDYGLIFLKSLMIFSSLSDALVHLSSIPHISIPFEMLIILPPIGPTSSRVCLFAWNLHFLS